MIEIRIPKTFIEERKYTLDHIFTTILGEAISIECHEVEQYHITLPNNKKIVIEDAFFSGKGDNYLSKNNLPKRTISIINEYTPEIDLPILFGDKKITEYKNIIYIEHDIIASAFFFLSRWEEYVIEERDEYDRFPEHECFAVKNNIIQRPLVNEYAMYILNLAAKLEYEMTPKPEYQFSMTVDLDMILKWSSQIDFIKTLGGDLLKRTSLSLALKNNMRRRMKHDPYNTFAHIQNLGEKYQVKSTFYFLMNARNTRILQSDFGKQLIHQLKIEGHTLGIHPDINSYKNAAQVMREKQALETFISDKVADSRQHYLQCSVPSIWNILHKSGLRTDSSLYFNSNPGFRSGTCTPHKVFDFIKSKRIPLVEYPLNFMDQSLFYMKTPEKAFETCSQIIATTKKYKGHFTFLWHNSSFNDPDWIENVHFFEDILKLS